MTLARTWMWILMLAALCGCAKKLALNEFAPYVEDFQKAAEQQGKPIAIDNLVIEFGTIDKAFGHDTVGICRLWEIPTHRIVIDREYWDAATEIKRRTLVWHELGHCVLNRNHEDSMRDDHPASLMNAELLKDEVFEAHENYYRIELFNPENPRIPYRD